MIVTVDPATLRLPPARSAGADPFKLADQIRRFGADTTGMPAVQATRGAGGLLTINDGVTRATRVAKLRPGTTMSVEIIDERPNVSLEHLTVLAETL